MMVSEITARLKEGNSRFVSGNSYKTVQDINKRESLIDGQNPFAVILGCADSRIAPEIIFDTGLGELFVVRVAGNVANTSSVASIEYAIAQLEVKVIVVLGHQNCGAVTAAVQGGGNGSNIRHLLSHIAPSVKASSKKATIDDVAIENVLLTSKELIENSEIIKNAVNSGQLKIVSAFYWMNSGKVDFLEGM